MRRMGLGRPLPPGTTCSLMLHASATTPSFVVLPSSQTTLVSRPSLVPDSPVIQDFIRPFAFSGSAVPSHRQASFSSPPPATPSLLG